MDSCSSGSEKGCNLSAEKSITENNISMALKNDWRVEAVLGPEYTNPISTVDVFVDVIVDKRHTSRLVQELAQLSPIPSLKHLKRVCPDGRIIICLAEENTEKKSLLIKQKVNEDVLNFKDCCTGVSRKLGNHGKRSFSESFEGISETSDRSVVMSIAPDHNVSSKEMSHLERDPPKECMNTFLLLPSLHTEGLRGQLQKVAVPAMPPLTRSQYNKAQRIWSCNFHPIKAIEEALSVGAGLSDKEFATLQSVMQMCFTSAEVARAESCAAAVNLRTGHTIALALDARDSHPLQHSAMRIVDLVARTQGGGVWPVLPGEKLAKESSDSSEGNSSLYLCTGLDVIMTREPCAMCAMALTHARASRVFFSTPNVDSGVLFSHTPLFHTIPGLNHRFRVFRVYANKNTILQ